MLSISEAKERIRIVDVVADAGVRLRQSGRRWSGHCPFHDDRTPSFLVFPDQGRFHCYGCWASGDAIDFVRRLYGLSFPDALRTLGIDRGQLTPQVRVEIDRRRHRRELVKLFRQWENDKADELAIVVRNTRRLLTGIKTMDDLERVGDLFHGLDGLEYDFEVLTTASKENVLGYFRNEIKRYLHHGF